MKKTILKSLTEKELKDFMIKTKKIGVTQVNDDIIIIRIFEMKD